MLQNIETDFKNAETCRPRSDLGRHFFADLNFDSFRGLFGYRLCQLAIDFVTQL